MYKISKNRKCITEKQTKEYIVIRHIYTLSLLFIRRGPNVPYKKSKTRIDIKRPSEGQAAVCVWWSLCSWVSGGKESVLDIFSVLCADSASGKYPVLTCFWCGSNVVLMWFWRGSDVVLMWFWHGSDVVRTSGHGSSGIHQHAWNMVWPGMP